MQVKVIIRKLKGNVTVYKDLNIEFVTKKSFCNENAV